MQFRFGTFFHTDLIKGKAFNITRNFQGVTIDKLEKKASAINFSFTPKICLSSLEDTAGDTSFEILPVNNISKVEAEGNNAIINQSNPSS